MSAVARLAVSREELRSVFEPPRNQTNGGGGSPGDFPRSRTLQMLMSGRGLGTLGALAAGLMVARPALALRMLRAAGLLHYPADPLVLDSWELENIFDAEFGESVGTGKRRREAIRREHEAFWNTGTWNPGAYVPADPPITTAERTSFSV